MSAYVVDDIVIDAIVTAAYRFRYEPHRPLEIQVGEIPEFPEAYRRGAPWGDISGVAAWLEANRRTFPIGEESEVGRILLAENQNSVNFRYDEVFIEHPYTFTPIQNPNPFYALKAMATWRYQSCEHPEYWKSTARWIVERAQESTLDFVVRHADTSSPSIRPPWVESRHGP